MQESDDIQDGSWNLGWRGGNEDVKTGRDNENPEGARNCRIGGVEGLSDSGKDRRWYIVGE